ncbi:MAG: carboxypeptidase-like regulatory domain-containing protein, partial [Acidobacteria bacterium]|nr:carboxypeptidase-like regulatory domain-containing protein [Acidobacteriota bacterium]
MNKAKRLLMLSLLFVVFSVVGYGQQSSSVTGVVTDTTGAVIRDVEVKLTDTRKGNDQTTRTNEQGVYQFVRIAPGLGYTLTFKAQGFESLELKNISLGVGITETHNVQLTVGQVTNTITVTSTGEGTLNTT